MATQYKVPVKDFFEWQSKVLSKSLSAAPGSPTKGHRYIVGLAVPSGDLWFGQSNKIAEYNGASWDFITPSTYFTVWVDDLVKIYYWNGSGWIDYALSAGQTKSKQTEIDFGSTGVMEKNFIIIDTDVTISSNITGSLAYVAPTGKDLDELEFDVLELRFAPGSGQFTLYAVAKEGLVADKFKINYAFNLT